LEFHNPVLPETERMPATGWTDALADAELDNFVVSFVELFNARDWEAMSGLFAPDAVSGFFDGRTRDEVISGMIDLVSRTPMLLVTRGDIGPEPVAAAWVLDETSGFEQVGYFTFGLSGGEEPLLDTVEYVEEIADPEAAVLEPPDPADREEWIRWLSLE